MAAIELRQLPHPQQFFEKVQKSSRKAGSDI